MVDWNKEIKITSLVGRGGKASPAAEPQPVAPAPAPVSAKPQKSSFWKKELSLGGKSKPKAGAEKPVAAPAQGPAAPTPQKTPFWKKEISLGRKPKTAAPEKNELPPAELPTAEAPEALPAPDPAFPEPAPALARIEFPVVETGPEPQVLEEAEPAVQDAPAPVIPLPAPHAPSPPAFEPEPAAWQPLPAEPFASEPVAASSPPESDLWPDEAWDDAPTTIQPEPASWLTEIVSADAAPVTEAPTPADLPVDVDLPVEAEPVEAVAKVPFWKKELSLGGKSKKGQPVGKAQEKVKRSRKERRGKDASEAAAPQATASTAKPPKRKIPKESRKLVGLKIGASQVAAARVENNGVPHLVQVARDAIAPGLVVGGEVKEPEALGAELKNFFSKHKLPRRGVRLGIANNRIGVRTFDVTGIEDPKQLTNAIRFRAQEVLPIPLDEAVMDYQVLDEWKGEDGGTVRRILLVVAYRELVDRYVEACRHAGIRLAGIDLEAFALLRALAEPGARFGAQEDSALVVVAIGHDRSTFAVSDGHTCEFTRVLDWGGASLNAAIAQVLDISPDEAEPIKRTISLVGPTASFEGVSDQELPRVVEAVRAQFQGFARDLVSSLRFYQNQPGSLGIGEIVVTGGTSQLPGLSAELERLLGVRVRVGDPLVRVKVGKKVGQNVSLSSLSTAIGLGIED